MTLEQKNWISGATQRAKMAGHIFPLMAACEAALESGYGQSKLAQLGNNLFGMKQHRNRVNGLDYETISLPTKEFINGVWEEELSLWIKYDSIQQCFEDRMETLRHLQGTFVEYREALAANTPQDYIFAVSKTWSTDPNRAQKVLAIYNEVANA